MRYMAEPRVVVDYWSGLMRGGEGIRTRGGLELSINPALDHHRRAMIFTWTSGRVSAAITPAIARRMPVELAALSSIDDLRDALTSAQVALHDPDLVWCRTGPIPPPSVAPPVVVRQLTAQDAAAFQAFQDAATEQDKDDASVELDHWAVFGVFDREKLVSAASIYPWGGAAIGDMGVLTLPRARGGGHARALVYAIGRHASAHGHELQYRCQHDNAASAALARSAGLGILGAWEVACAAPDPADPREAA